ncbi:zinc finger protein Eos-like isoform X7 [Takifugu flavidus]|uniref:zinc finger protein Eos-like isoform X7 n=1 Tax=Takifugu flavidus TaxID=433684 RepID=UPI0025446C9B|nr:zinc finger protein Eos-like isoform X7 [Takifugu flavidus]
MDVDDCNGQSNISASGDSSMEREFSGGLGGPTVSTPNSKETSPSRSLSGQFETNSIKVELYSDEDPGRSTEDERAERVEDGGPEQGSEAARGYREPPNPDILPTGPTRLPNGKIKCDICGMTCIGPNVLMVHKRSHTVSSPTIGKPFKCSYCGRSYKQQSTLEEHQDRCHSYLQSLESQQAASAANPGEEMRELEFIPDSFLQPTADKKAFIDRLANSITKRKRSTPQKFVGQKHIRLSLDDAAYELSAGLSKDAEMHTGELESPHFTGVGAEFTALTGNGGDAHRPLHLPATHPSCLSELRPILGSVHTSAALGPRLDCTGTGVVFGAAGVVGREAAEGHEDLPVSRSHLPSPSNGCQDSTDTESMPDELCNSTALTPTLHTTNSHHLVHADNHHPAPLPVAHRRPRDRRSPGHAKDREAEREDGGHPALPTALAPTPSSPTVPSSTSRETFRVVDAEGRAVRSFRCEHCRVLFLDHVMFTIHMGCHGFHQPFECNICGHRSQDRYEFSSHIVRGEHVLD